MIAVAENRGVGGLGRFGELVDLRPLGLRGEQHCEAGHLAKCCS